MEAGWKEEVELELELVDYMRHALPGFGRGDLAKATIMQGLVEDEEDRSLGESGAVDRQRRN